jgi:hypothetical protein
MDARESDLNRPESHESARISREIEYTRGRLDHTVSALQDKLTLGHLGQGLVDLVVDGAGEGSKKFMRGMRDNPIPSAIVGLGVAWFLAERTAARRARERYDYRDGPDGSMTGPSRIKETLGGAAAKVSGVAHQAAEHAASIATGVAHSAAGLSNAVREGAVAAKGGVAHLAEQARGAAAGVGHSAAQLSSAVRDRAVAAKGGVAHIAEHARDAAGRARRGLSDTYEDNPLALGAAAFALGLVGGLVAPTSGAEDRLMGRVSRDFKNRAKDLGKRAVEAGGNIASKTAQAAREASETGKTTGERLANAAEAALDTVATEATNQVRSFAGTSEPPTKNEATEAVGDTGPARRREPGWEQER